MPVGDRPALAHILGLLCQSGAGRVVVNTHHRAEDLVRWAGSTQAREALAGSELILVHESSILGTAGGVAHAGGELGPGPVLLWNGDLYAPALDPASVCDAFGDQDCDGLWVVEPRPVGEGTVGLGRDGQVVRVRDWSRGEEHAGGDYLGVQVLGEAMRRQLPAEGCLVGDLALPLLRRGARIGTHALHGTWNDLGSVAGLWAANHRWLQSRGLPGWTAPSACIAPAVVISGSLVGEGAHVGGEGGLERCLVFPGAEACAPQAGHIISRRAAISVTAPGRAEIGATGDVGA